MKKLFIALGLSLLLSSSAWADIVWYVCPYDVEVGGEGPVRRAAIYRYIPSAPNPDGSNWNEAEIMGNHVVVKVDAPASVHTTIQADADFRVIPHTEATIPTARRTAIRDKLLSLGYVLKEINDTNWITANLFRLLTSARNKIIPNATNDGITILPERIGPAKTVDDINRELQG